MTTNDRALAEMERQWRNSGRRKAARADIAHAIAQSIAQNEIVSLDWTQNREDALLVAQDDGVDAGDVVEAWGEEDGQQWRVHLIDRPCPEVTP